MNEYYTTGGLEKNRNVYEADESNNRVLVYPVTRTSAIYLDTDNIDKNKLNKDSDRLDVKLYLLEQQIEDLQNRLNGHQLAIDGLTGSATYWKTYYQLIKSSTYNEAIADFKINVSASNNPNTNIGKWQWQEIDTSMERGGNFIWCFDILCQKKNVEDQEVHSFVNPYQYTKPRRYNPNGSVTFNLNGILPLQIYQMSPSKSDIPSTDDLIGIDYSTLPDKTPEENKWCKQNLTSFMSLPKYYNNYLFACDIKLKLVEDIMVIESAGVPYCLGNGQQQTTNISLFYDIDNSDSPGVVPDIETANALATSQANVYELQDPWSISPHLAQTKGWEVYQITARMDSLGKIVVISDSKFNFYAGYPEQDKANFIWFPTIYRATSSNDKDAKDVLTSSLKELKDVEFETLKPAESSSWVTVKPALSEANQFIWACVCTVNNEGKISAWTDPELIEKFSIRDQDGTVLQHFITLYCVNDVNPGEPLRPENEYSLLDSDLTLGCEYSNSVRWSVQNVQMSDGAKKFKCTIQVQEYQQENGPSIITWVGVSEKPQEIAQNNTQGAKGVTGQACRIRSLKGILKEESDLRQENAPANQYAWAFPPGDITNYAGNANVNQADLTFEADERYAKFYDIIVDDVRTTSSMSPTDVKYYIATYPRENTTNDPFTAFRISSTLCYDSNGNFEQLDPNYWEESQQFNMLSAQVAVIQNLVAEQVEADKVLITASDKNTTQRLQAGMLNGQQSRTILKKYLGDDSQSLDDLYNESSSKVRIFAGLNEFGDSDKKGLGFALNDIQGELDLTDSNFYVTQNGDLYVRNLHIIKDKEKNPTIDEIIKEGYGSIRDTLYTLVDFDPTDQGAETRLEQLPPEQWSTLSPAYTSGENKHKWVKTSFYAVGDIPKANPLGVTYDYVCDMSKTDGIAGPTGDSVKFLYCLSNGVPTRPLSINGGTNLDKSSTAMEIGTKFGSLGFGNNVTYNEDSIKGGQSLAKHPDFRSSAVLEVIGDGRRVYVYNFDIGGSTVTPSIWVETPPSMTVQGQKIYETVSISNQGAWKEYTYPVLHGYYSKDGKSVQGRAGQIARIRSYAKIKEQYAESDTSWKPEFDAKLYPVGAEADYYDIMTVVEGTEIQYYEYVGKSGDLLAYSEKFGDNRRWKAAQELDFIHANTIVTNAISSEMADTKKLLIKDNDDKVVGGLLGHDNDYEETTYDSGGNIIMFAGDDNPADADFKVYDNGTVIANKLKLTGDTLKSVQDSFGNPINLLRYTESKIVPTSATPPYLQSIGASYDTEGGYLVRTFNGRTITFVEAEEGRENGEDYTDVCFTQGINNIEVLPNTNYTLSFEYKLDKPTTILSYLYDGSNSGIISGDYVDGRTETVLTPESEWTKVTITWKTKNSNNVKNAKLIVSRFKRKYGTDFELSLRKIKLEKGSVATEYNYTEPQATFTQDEWNKYLADANIGLTVEGGAAFNGTVYANAGSFSGNVSATSLSVQNQGEIAMQLVTWGQGITEKMMNVDGVAPGDPVILMRKNDGTYAILTPKILQYKEENVVVWGNAIIHYPFISATASSLTINQSPINIYQYSGNSNQYTNNKYYVGDSGTKTKASGEYITASYKDSAKMYVDAGNAQGISCKSNQIYKTIKEYLNDVLHCSYEYVQGSSSNSLDSVFAERKKYFEFAIINKYKDGNLIRKAWVSDLKQI